MGYDDFSGKVEEHSYDGEPHSFNTFWLGLAVSVIMPVVCLLAIVYFTGAAQFNSLRHVVHVLMSNNSAYMTNIYIMALMPSMFGFFWAYKTERWKFGRGYIVGTLLFLVFFFARTLL